MTFPAGWTSIANPDNVIVSTIEPIFLADNISIPGVAPLPPIEIPRTQPYTLYVQGAFSPQTLAFEWSLDDNIYTPLLGVFDNLPIEFSSSGLAQLPRLSAGIFVRVVNLSGLDTVLMTIVLK